MKILVSTKALAEALDSIPRDQFIERANLDEGRLSLIAQTMSTSLCVEILDFEASIRQSNREWEHIHSLMKKCDEQPVILSIHENIINVTFQF